MSKIAHEELYDGRVHKLSLTDKSGRPVTIYAAEPGKRYPLGKAEGVRQIHAIVGDIFVDNHGRLESSSGRGINNLEPGEDFGALVICGDEPVVFASWDFPPPETTGS